MMSPSISFSFCARVSRCAAARLAVAALVVSALGHPMGCATTSGQNGGAGERVPPNEAWREGRPPAGAAPEFKLPTFQTATLKNGMVVYVIEDHSLPTVHARVAVRAGSANENQKEAGLAALTYDLLDEGAGTYSQQALANAFARLGAELTTEAGREVGSIEVDLLKKHLAEGLDLVGAVVMKPTFAAADFDRLRANHLAALTAREGEPTEIARVVASTLVFGADHPYGHDHDGSASALEKLTAARVKKFWTDGAGPKTSALILAGDITLAEAEALGEKTFGKWKGTAKPAPAPADPKPQTALKLAFVDVPGAPQTVLRLGRPGIAVGDPDEPAMVVFNEILGGAFTSRLNLKLREEKQWTYGAQSFFEARLGKGPFGAQASIETPFTADALEETLKIFDAMKADGATDDEVARAKDGYIRALPSTFGLPNVQGNAASTLFAHGLPADHYTAFVEKLKAVTKDDVKRVAARVLNKDELVVVLVGDKVQVLPKLTEKKLGDVAAFTRDGAPAK